MIKKPEPDLVAERSILAGILCHGSDSYLDVADILSWSSFTNTTHQVIYQCINHIYDGKDEVKKIDPATLLSSSKEVGYGNFFENPTESQYLRALFNFGSTVQVETVRKLAGKVRRLEIAQNIQNALIESTKSLGEIDGTESVEQLLTIAEQSVGKEIEKLMGQSGTQTKLIGDGIDDFLQNIIDNPDRTYGISSGYPQYDKDIGGGFIRKELDIIGARAKTGKSICVDNIGYFVAERLGIPILNIDTELSQEQHWTRMLAMISGVDMEEIKTGTFSKDPEKLRLVLEAKQKIKSVPYYYECVGGRIFEEVLSIMRRWVQKTVGVDENGVRKPCLIIYDYIKMLNEDGINGNMQEYQKLGFMVTSIKNFLIRYDVPCLAFVQLNRDGIDGNATSAVAGSDRILMYCSSLAFLKDKTVEEIEEDGLSNGNKKIFVVAARNGPGTDGGDYINYTLHKGIARLTEEKRASELKADREYKEAFGYEGDGDEEIII